MNRYKKVKQARREMKEEKNDGLEDNFEQGYVIESR